MGWISVRARQEETARVLTLPRNFSIKGKRKGDVDEGECELKGGCF